MKEIETHVLDNSIERRKY